MVKPLGKTDEPMLIRILEVLPNSVGLGFEGMDYKVIRSEIYNGGIDTDDKLNRSK
jgi:hypothetical protein